MAADTLGSLYLGDVTVPELRVAGRLGGDDDSVATLAAMADVAPDAVLRHRLLSSISKA